MEFILASSNSHKAEELNELLKNASLSIKASSKKFDIVEDGESFLENALLKARGYFNELKVPTVSDDSGLVIPKRSDILGIHSARFASDLSDYKDKNEALLEEIKGLKDEDRKAYFLCVLCFYLSEDEYYFFEGRVHGVIGEKASGNDGFGYDPIFYPDGLEGLSLAEAHEWKMQNSHRVKACHSAVNFFKS